MLDGRKSVVGPDQMSLVTPYRFAPVYTMCHVGFNEMFRPTGGQLLFRFTKPANNISRNIMTREYSDILTLKELNELMTNPNPYSKLSEMYRPLIEDDEGRVSLVKLANNVIPYGVTSIHQCKDWHKDFMTTVQPVMINGACHMDRTDYTKQDTLRIPADMCEIIKGRPEDPKHFVYMTFHKPRVKDWQPKFVVTPMSNYVNKEMKESEGYSLVFPLGIIDYLDNGADNTSVYLFRPATVVLDKQPEEPVWMIEGFVFHTLSEWRLTYDKDPIEFYTYMVDNDRWRYLMLDPGKRFITRAVEKMMAAEDEDSNNDDDDDEGSDDEGAIGGKRKRGGRKQRHKKRPRFYGFGTAGGGGDGGGRGRLGLYPKMTPNDRNSISDNPTPGLQLDFALHRGPYRKIKKHILATISRPFQGRMHNFMDRLNDYVEREMQAKARIQTYRLTEGYSVTMYAEDIFLVLAMAFLNRLRITGDSDRAVKAARGQMNMDKLFDPPSTEKLKCLVNYFVKGLTDTTNFVKSGRAVTFFHKPLTAFNNNNTLYEADQVLAGGPKIEDVEGAVWADFANNRFGGGVFKRGAVQEEILLIIHPEALMGRALFAPMSPTGSCVVMGAVRVSNYAGYGSKTINSQAFAYNGSVPFNPADPLDADNRALTEILAFDAQNFKSAPRKQYGQRLIAQEYDRAVAAFSHNRYTNGRVPIVSGLWGSGDFGGDPVLKLLLQVAAATATGRRLILVKIGANRKSQIDEITDLATSMRLTCREFIDVIKDAVKNVRYKRYNRHYNATQTAVAVTKCLKDEKIRRLRMGYGGRGGGGGMYGSGSFGSRYSSGSTDIIGSGDTNDSSSEQGMQYSSNDIVAGLITTDDVTTREVEEEEVSGGKATTTEEESSSEEEQQEEEEAFSP